MTLLDPLILGWSVAVTPENLLFCLIGCLLGTAIGVLPGIGPLATMSLLMPITFHLPPVAALIMMAGIYYGAQYGGSTTAILVRVPGEASSIVTCIDGYAMARSGRAGHALAIAAIASFVAGTVSTLLVAIASPQLSRVALAFGPWEYAALMVFGLVAAVILAAGSVLNAFAMIAFGIALGLVGTDSTTSDLRMTLGLPFLYDGIDFVPLVMGLFGVAEVIFNLSRQERTADVVHVGRLMPRWAELREAAPAMLRGTGLGSVLGVLPGGGALISSFAAYSLEKKLARDPSAFGNGAVAGVAAPEAANNAGAQTSFVPMLSLGIPSNAVMALMIGVMTIHGIVPGPRVVTAQPDLFWGMIVSMWVGNAMLVILNLPLIGIWTAMLRIPYRYLGPSILIFCSVGTYTVNNSVPEVLMMAVFGLLGVLLRILRFDAAPLLLGFVLGPMLEDNFRRAQMLSDGDFSRFLTRPISCSLVALSLLLILALAVPWARRNRTLLKDDD